ncbi:MAG: hypothetical protein ACO1OF_03480, partial [Adhaeribacter sp.]
ESSAWGAAMLALQALNLTPDILSLPDQSTHEQEYLPNPERHAVYMQNFSIFEKLYPLLKDQLAAIGNLPKE